MPPKITIGLVLLIILSACLPLLVILGTAKEVIFDQNFYAKEFVKNHNQVENRDAVINDVLDYLDNNKNSLDSNFTSTEKVHMKDVKDLMNAFWVIYYIILIVTILLIILILIKFRDFDKVIINYLFFGGALALIAIIFFILFATVGFNFFFDSFHQIFFKPGTWMFSQDDLLIRMFPFGLFQDAVILIFGLSLAKALLIFYAGFFLKNFTGFKLSGRNT